MGRILRTAIVLGMVFCCGLGLAGCSWAFDVWQRQPEPARWSLDEKEPEPVAPTCNRWPALGDTILAGFCQTTYWSASAFLGYAIIINGLSDDNEYGNTEALTALITLAAHGLAHVFLTASTVNGWTQYAKCTEERERILHPVSTEQIVAGGEATMEDRPVPARSSDWYVGFGQGIGLATFINSGGGLPVYHLAFEAGWIIDPQFTLGAKISHTGLVVLVGNYLLEISGRWYPWPDAGLYLGAGLGLSAGWFLEDGQDANVVSDLGLGLGGTITYEFRLGDSLHLGLGLVYQTQWWPGIRSYFHSFSVPVSFGWY